MQDVISPVQPEDYPHVVEVWEAFVSAADIQVFKPLACEGLPQNETLL